MRVVIVNRYVYPDHAATAQLASDLASALGARGIEVLMLGSQQRYDDPQARLPKRETGPGFGVRRVATTRFGRGGLLGRALDYASFYFSAGAALLGELKAGDVVLAKTDPPLLGVVVALAARVRGARQINWLQDLFPDVAVALGTPRLPAALRVLAAWLADRALTAAWINVAIGERMAERLLAAGVALERVSVIPNWPHQSPGEPLAPAASALRAALGLGRQFVVGYSGNLGRAHDSATLLDAAQRLQHHPHIQWLFIGGGHGLVQLQAEAQRLGLRHLRFAPYQPLDALADAMAASDVHLVSLKPELEGLIVPSKFFGVLAAARPTVFIGDGDGEIGRLVRGHDCGVVVAPGDGAALAAVLLALAQAPQRVAAMGAAGQRLLRQRFGRERAHADWAALIERVAAAPSRQGLAAKRGEST